MLATRQYSDAARIIRDIHASTIEHHRASTDRLTNLTDHANRAAELEAWADGLDTLNAKLDAACDVSAAILRLHPEAAPRRSPYVFNIEFGIPMPASGGHRT